MNQTSYHAVYSEWLQNDLRTNKTPTIFASRFVTSLQLFEIVSNSEAQLINHETTNEEQNRVLFLTILPQKGENGLEKVIEILKKNGDTEILGYLNDIISRKTVVTSVWGDPPSRNKCFTGRQQLMKEVKSIFNKAYEENNSYSATVVICGMEGVGKTQFAAEFLFKFENNYKRTFWIESENIEAAYRQIAERFQLNVKVDPDVVKKMKIWFGQSCAPCLLVFDDADTFEQVESFLPDKGCHILVTSLNNNWPTIKVDRCFPLDVFSIDESKYFIRSILTTKVPVVEDEIVNLSTMLGHLPLALTQACALICESRLKVSEYIKNFEQQLMCTEERRSPQNLKAVFSTAFRISQSTIKQRSRLAEKLLCVCAYYQPVAIPTILLENAVLCLRSNTDHFDPGDLLKAMQTLIDLSLLVYNENQDQVSMHCLLQKTIRYQEILNEKQNLTVAIICLTSCYPENQGLPDVHLKRLLLPHLIEIYKSVSSYNFSNQNDQIPKQDVIALLQCCADACHIIGMCQDELVYLNKLLSVTIDYFGKCTPQVTGTLMDLGIAYGYVGNHQKEKDLLEESLEMAEKMFGPDHQTVAYILNNLGNACDAMGDVKKKKEILERALIILEKNLGPDHPDVAINLTNLGNAYGSLGDQKTKKDLLERALAIDENHFGMDCIQVATTLTNLGSVYDSVGSVYFDPQKKSELLKRALLIKESYYGTNHIKLSSTLVTLGNAFGSLADHTKQKDILERALKIVRSHYGSDNSDVAIVLTNLASAYGSLGDCQSQKAYAETALKIFEEHFGNCHPYVAFALLQLAQACGALGDPNKQIQLLEKSLSIQDNYFGAGHPESAITLANLAIAYASVDNKKKKKELSDRALQILEIHSGPDSIDTAVMLDMLVNSYGSYGEYRTRIAMLEQALKIFEKHYGVDCLLYANTKKRLIEAKSFESERFLQIVSLIQI